MVNGPPDTLPTAFLGSLEVLATNPYGCRVVQKMFELMPDEAKRELLDEMHPISMVLMQDQFGSECSGGRDQGEVHAYCRLCCPKRHYRRFRRRPLEGCQPSQGSDVPQ